MRWRRAAALPTPGILAGVLGTAVVHAGLLGLVLATLFLRPSVKPPVVYSVELIAAPARPPTTRSTPAPTPTPPPTVAPKATKTVPVPKPKAPPKVDPKAEPAKPRAAPPPNAGVQPGPGTDVENVRVEGLVFPFPDYLRNIMNEIMRRWARPVGAGDLSAEVSFTIRRDGSVEDIKLIRSSRSYTFDLEAQGAVEQAAQDRAFGRLPSGWQSDILKVAFLFTPRRP